MRDRKMSIRRIWSIAVAAAVLCLALGACSPSGKIGQDAAENEAVGQGNTTVPEQEEMMEAGSEEPQTSIRQEPVLCLNLPEDESLYSSPVRSQDVQMLQINFHDESTQSDAMAWASMEAEGGPSGYYVFDEEGTEKRMVSAGDGPQMEMTIKKTVQNSDIHGILVSWEFNGVFYELWEDDAREQGDDVIRMAAEIAVQSIGESEISASGGKP